MPSTINLPSRDITVVSTVAINECNNLNALPGKTINRCGRIGDCAMGNSWWRSISIRWLSNAHVTPVQLTKTFLEGVCLSEDQKLGILLTFEIAPCVLLPMVDVHILENLIPVDDVLWFEVLFNVDRLFVAQGQRIVMQRSAKRLPYGDVLNTPVE